MAKLHRSMRAELEWAIQLLCSIGTPEYHQLDTIRRAVDAGSPILHKRFDQFFISASPREMEPEDRNRIGALMMALRAHAEGRPWRLYQPGEFDTEEGEEPKRALIQFRAPETFKLRLQTYCQRTGRDMSDVLRKAVDAYLADNPLWQGVTPEDAD